MFNPYDALPTARIEEYTDAEWRGLLEWAEGRLVVPRRQPRRHKPRKPSKPSIAKLVKQLEKAGKHVTSVTRDGVINFGEPTAALDTTNDLDNWIAKHAGKIERH
jgi:hypothetical protein